MQGRELMKQLIFEIARQKWRLLGVIVFLLLVNGIFGVFAAVYQEPALVQLQNKWSSLRRQSVGTGPVDAASLYHQGNLDLAKLEAMIPEKRQFARVLSVFIEAAGTSAVEMGAITYKPVAIKGEKMLSYQLSLSVSGSYAAVKSYLADLQKNRELIVIDSVTFANRDLFIENVVMNMNITIYLREGA
jgi:type IV pilus assembly protein PilO